MRYFKALVSIGHQGANQERETWIFVKAQDMYRAMQTAKRLPAVKHSRTPIKVQEITEEEYLKGKQKNDYYNKLNNIFNV